MLGFFTQAEKALAQEMLSKLESQLTPDMFAGQAKLLSVNKVTRLLEQSYRLAEAHQRERRPGFVKRAALANQFKWALLDKGYPKEFVDVAVEGLVVALAKIAARKAPDAPAP